MLISDLAQSENIPKKFLEQILLELKNEGILHSKKGKGGGYYLAKHPKSVTMGQIIRCIDGPLAPVPCVSVTAYGACTECRDEMTCGIRMVMKTVRDSIADILDHKSIESVIEWIEQQKIQSSAMYYI